MDFDYQAAVEALQPLYKTRSGLHRALGQCWCDAADLISCPAAWRSATALAERLLACGTLHGFPADCHILDQSPVPGLAAAGARLQGDFARTFEEDLLLAIEWGGRGQRHAWCRATAARCMRGTRHS